MKRHSSSCELRFHRYSYDSNKMKGGILKTDDEPRQVMLCQSPLVLVTVFPVIKLKIGKVNAAVNSRDVAQHYLEHTLLG